MQSTIRHEFAGAYVSYNSLFNEINFVCFTLSCLVFETDTSATWEFNGSEIRALKTAPSHKRTNQSSTKPNNRGPCNWFATTAAVAR